jgi:hypothetical protein
VSPKRKTPPAPGPPPAPRKPWIIGGAIALAVVAAGIVAMLVLLSGSHPGPAHVAPAARPVTEAEADRLAVTRFQNYRAKGVGFRTQVATSGGPLAIIGDVDFREGLGYAQVSGAGSAFTLQWSDRTLLAWPSAAGVLAPPARLPVRKPVGRPLAPAKSSVDAVLAVLLGLGADRPDNAQLIRRNGARWLRSATIGDTKVDVLQGPSATGSTAASGAAVRYWVDATGHLLRVDAFLGGGSSATTIDLDTSSYTPFARYAKPRS